MEISREQADQIGRLADQCENLVGATQIPIPAATHLLYLRESLTAMAEDIKAWVVTVTGEDPWADAPKGEARP